MGDKRETPESMNHPTWKEMYEEMQKDRDQWMNLALDLQMVVSRRDAIERQINEKRR
jgi:hypothetical protein